jgi:hypothetical protein
MADNTQSPDVPEPVDLHITDGQGQWQRDEPVQLGDNPFPKGSTGDPNAGAWKFCDSLRKGK